jgi:hypothetical protein
MRSLALRNRRVPIGMPDIRRAAAAVAPSLHAPYAANKMLMKAVHQLKKN